jgi:hypothetical protein
MRRAASFRTELLLVRAKKLQLHKYDLRPLSRNQINDIIAHYAFYNYTFIFWVDALETVFCPAWHRRNFRTFLILDSTFTIF